MITEVEDFWFDRNGKMVSRSATPHPEPPPGDWGCGYAKGYARALQQVIEQVEFKVGSDRQYSTDARWVMDQVYEVVEMLRKLDDHD